MGYEFGRPGQYPRLQHDDCDGMRRALDSRFSQSLELESRNARDLKITDRTDSLSQWLIFSLFISFIIIHTVLFQYAVVVKPP